MNIGYIISLPERAVRAMGASIGGFIYEASLLAFPGWFRRTRIYTAIVAGLLRIVIELVGGASGIMPPREVSAEELAVRKAAGTGIELVGLLTLGWSPLWIFAATADITGGARTYLRELVAELKRDGFLSADEEIETVEELLDTLENSSGVAAETLDIPPLNIRDMRQTWSNLRHNAASLPDADRLASIYAGLQQIAKKERTSLYAMSSSIGSAALRAGIQTGSIHIFDFYVASYRTIRAEGLAKYTQRVTLPYRMVAISHFDPLCLSYTERFLRHIGIIRTSKRQEYIPVKRKNKSLKKTEILIDSTFPPAAKRWLERSLPDEFSVPTQVQIQQKGEMDLRGQWTNFSAEGNYQGAPISFNWKAKFGIIPGVWIIAEDGHADQKGWGGAKLWGVIPMGRNTQPEVFAVQMVRNIAELAWLPDLAVSSPELTWNDAGEDGFEIRCSAGKQEALVRFTINERGEIINACSPSRPYDVPGGFSESPWRYDFENQREFDGFLVPSAAVATYEKAEGTWEYLRIQVISIKRA